jgi:hypothetical protein
MYFKLLHNNSEGKPIFARVDDDGLYRLTCTEEHPEFKAWIEAGNTPEPAEGAE